jgi:hypothetical protein
LPRILAGEFVSVTSVKRPEDVDVRSRAITRKLRDVEELPENPQPLFPELLSREDEL